MNLLVVAVAVIILLCAWDGHRRGFIKKAVGIISWIAILWLTSVLSPVIAAVLPNYTGLAFLIALLLVSVPVKGVLFALGIVARLPVLHGLNKMAGLVLGLGEGLLYVWILFVVVTVFSGTEWGGTLFGMIADSPILVWIYRNNILFSMI